MEAIYIYFLLWFQLRWTSLTPLSPPYNKSKSSDEAIGGLVYAYGMHHFFPVKTEQTCSLQLIKRPNSVPSHFHFTNFLIISVQFARYDFKMECKFWLSFPYLWFWTWLLCLKITSSSTLKFAPLLEDINKLFCATYIFWIMSKIGKNIN